MKPGELIGGQYRIERVRGRGGMGTVYEAFDLRTERRRALKVMHAEYVADPDVRARFEREGKLAARLDSPYFVDVQDARVDEATGAPFMVMELLDGENLEQRLKRLGARPADEVVAHLAHVAIAVQRMHDRGVVHRDLKPSNLFHDRRDDDRYPIKVLDLGIAKVLRETAGLTRAGIGTAPYMAPEQVHGAAIGPAADRYALGAIAFTLLTGADYFTDGPLETARVPAGERARALGLALPPAFDAWFARATAWRAAARFGSALEQVHALAGALGVEPPPCLPEAPAPARAPDDEPDEAAAEDTTAGALALAPTAAAHLPSPTAAPPAARSRPRARWVAASGLIALAAAGAAWRWPRSRSQPAPLAGPDAVLACPLLEVEDAADRWLGAAAAGIVCDRARVMLGGLPSRTRGPAELLELGDATDYRGDPYGEVDARERSLRAARARGTAFVDGRVTRPGRGFHVELVVRTPAGTEIARGAGDDASLPVAVRAAMQPLRDRGAIPDRPIDPVVADHARARDVATALHLVDLEMAFVNDTGNLAAECAWLDDTTTDLASFLRWLCRFQIGDAAPAVTLPPATTPGALTARARASYLLTHAPDPVALALLLLQFEAAGARAGESSAWARSVIASTLSCMYEKVDALQQTDQAVLWAERAVENGPRNPTGEWCHPWGQLVSLVHAGPRRERAGFQWRVWTPWKSYAWLYASRFAADHATRLTYARRAYELSPFDTSVATRLFEELLRDPQLRAEAQPVADRLGASRHAAQRMAGRLLKARYQASMLDFGQAGELARTVMEEPDTTGWGRVLQLQAASYAVTFAAIRGDDRATADRAIATVVEPHLHHVQGSNDDELRVIIAICAQASPAAAARCFDALDASRDRLGGFSATTTSFLAGARRHAAGDRVGAAESWRPLLRGADDHVATLAGAMVLAFAATGHDEPVVAAIVERAAADAPFLGGTTLATAYAARVAAARGDAAARGLAQQVLTTWAKAVPRPPILDEMRALLR